MVKKAHLIFAQIDHVSGEITGFAIGKIMELGANNVQLIPTITKKNRPGYIIIIDTDAKHEKEIAKFLVRELKISGYHRIGTNHIFHKITFIKKNLKININGKSRSVHCEIKLIGDKSRPLSVDIEHDFLVTTQKILMDKSNSFISLSELRSTIESKLKGSREDITI